MQEEHGASNLLSLICPVGPHALAWLQDTLQCEFEMQAGVMHVWADPGTREQEVFQVPGTATEFFSGGCPGVRCRTEGVWGQASGSGRRSGDAKHCRQMLQDISPWRTPNPKAAWLLMQLPCPLRCAADMHWMLKVISLGHVRTFTHHRLLLLEQKFNLHVMLNAGEGHRLLRRLDGSSYQRLVSGTVPVLLSPTGGGFLPQKPAPLLQQPQELVASTLRIH